MEIAVCMVIFLLFLAVLFMISTIIGLFTILPEKKRNQSNFFLWVKSFWKHIKSDNVKLSKALVGAVFLLILMFIPLLSAMSCFIGENHFLIQTLKNIRVEFIGMLFDAILLVWVFQWISAKGDKERRIQHLKDEMEDFIQWNSEEAKYRIRGILYRLNKEGVTEVELTLSQQKKYIDLKNMNLENIDLSGSNLLQVDFSGSFLINANFSNLPGSTSVCFNNNSELMWAKFIGSNLQSFRFKGAYLGFSDFSNATLIRVDFTGARLKSATFANTKFESVILDDAEVSKDFEEKIQVWQIKWLINGHQKSIFDDYVIEKTITAPNHSGKDENIRYFLKKR